MLRKLHIRLIIGLAALMLLFGISTFAMQLANTMSCVQEVHQKMHQDLASKLVETWLSNEGPKLVKGRVSLLFKDVLDANPQLTIYLLNAEGEIVCSSATQQLQSENVALRPINAFLGGNAAFPIYGSNPGNENAPCLFSAAPIMDHGQTIGYLYVLLEDEGGKSVNKMIGESSAMWVSMSATVAGLLLVMVAGTLLVTRSTSRIRALADNMEAFRKSAFTKASVFEKAKEGSTDEINRLQRVSSQMAERIAEQINELHQASEFRRELVTNVGHDLRTPLASLQGYLESIKLKSGSLDPEEREKYLDIAINNARRLGTIVEEMNELSCLDNGSIQLNREPIAVQDLLNDVLMSARDLLNCKEIDTEITVPDEITNISGDVQSLSRAFSNIIAHIVRNAQDGTKLSSVVRDQDEYVSVELTDPGRFISEQDQQFLFDRVYQQEGNPIAKSGGRGLAISHRIISLHGGSIRALSSKNTGTTISVTLPKF